MLVADVISMAMIGLPDDRNMLAEPSKFVFDCDQQRDYSGAEKLE